MKQKMHLSALRRAASAILALAISGGATAQAGIKYWDNQDYKAYDVGDYVTGAVWNYDGICNNGANRPHSTTNTTWKNLGTGAGSEPEVYLQKYNGGSSWSAATAVELSAGTYGEWTDKGFILKGNARLRRDSPGRIDTGTKYTIQFLVDANANNQNGKSNATVFNSNWDSLTFAINVASGNLRWKTKMSYNNSDDAPFISGPSFDYVTAIANEDDGTTVLFSGTEAPTSGDGYRKYSSISGNSEAGYAFGSTPNGAALFTGTLYSFRYYQKVLSNEEVAWNRVVDEARYFNRVAPLPVTNAVIVSSVAASTEPAGTYAVDGRHVFTAPRVATVDNNKYICTGYTLETWDGEACDWGTAVFHARELSCKVENADCVRITWQWMDGDGLVTYDVSDYVWDGLEVFYDGICNQGTNVAHSMTATTWVNLGSVGSNNDVFVQRLNAAGTSWETAADLNPVGERDPGYWTDNGFRLDAEGRLRCNAPGGFTVGTSYSLQMLVDAKASDQVNSYYAYLLGAQQDNFALRLHPTNGKLFFRYASGSADSPYLSGGTYDYVTAIMRDTNKQTIFSGTTEPTSGDGYRTNSACAYSDTGFAFGGYSKTGADNRCVGTFKSFRQYDHALSAEEVAQNRKVDDFRYFGKFAETDVIVQSTYPALRGNEPDGEYDVDVSRTFTAPASVTIKVNGREIEYTCDGYTVETWGALANKGDGWSAATHHAGNSYSYSTSAGKVRLTWKWKATRGLRTAADYSFADYSQAGIVWNFDGIYNQGVGAERSTTATTWKNLAPNAVTPELFVQRINSGRNGYDNSSALSSLAPSGDRDPGEWTDDGFLLKGDSRWRGLGVVGPVANWTLQTLVDADVNDVVNDVAYIVNVSWPSFAMVLRKNGSNPTPNSLHFNVQNAEAGGSPRPYFQNESGKYDYTTAILDSSDRTAKMFQGVTPPTGGDIADGYYQYSSITPFKDTNFGIGASTSYTEYFIGTLKSVRYYDRVLTQEEIVRNRNVDAVRYFGALGVTNVYVVAGGGSQSETGAYKVEGEWTFSAETILEKGVEKPVTGYCTEELVNGVWKHKTRHEGTTYTYVEGTAPAAVRLTWSGPPPGFLMIVR